MRFLHTRIRVRDLDRSIDFYKLLGLEMRGRSTSPRGNALAFLADPESRAEIELCRIPGDDAFSFPEDIFHIAFQVGNLASELDRLGKAGVKITEPITPTGRGALAFIEDPDGYEIELLERHA